MNNITLEDILHKYKFVPKSKKVFRKNVIWVDDLPEIGTKAGYKGYSKLISLLYDIAHLTGDLIAVNMLVDELDQIMSNGEY